MTGTLLERYAAQIDGVLSCFDRIILSGTLTGVCFPNGMAGWFRQKNLKLFEYPKQMDIIREMIRANAERVAKEMGLEIEFIRNIDAFRKETRIKEILVTRGEEPGLIHIFSAMEVCTCYKPWYDKATERTMLLMTKGKCLHYYFYFMDKEFGLCYLRVPTWAPFRLQFYCNGHNWLAWAMAKRQIEFTQVDNCFSHIADWDTAQKLSDTFPVDRLHRLCDRLAGQFCPVSANFGTSYHWSIMQCEYATDIAFIDKKTLAPLYETLSRAAIFAVKAPDVTRFLGRKLDKRYAGELDSSFHTRVEGTCIRHYMKSNAVKLYDKFGVVMRIETTTNDVTFFPHYRTVEHRDGTREKKYAPMQKTLYSLGPLREALGAVNRRYLAFISTLSDPSGGVRDLEKLSKTVHVNGRGFGGFNLFDSDDLMLFHTLTRGENCIAGICNRNIRKLTPSWSSSKVSLILKKLHLHGLIKRVAHRYHYYLTEFGRRTIVTALKLRELVVIPSLAFS
jgi:hypothetical protein